MIKSIFKTFFLSLCIIANTHFAYSQTASILPQGKTQFLDNNGKPLTSGTVDFYVPATTTRKTTWQNSGETVANTNPVVLDGGGRAIIYGDDSYRMVVKDRLGNLIYDQLTSSTGSGSTPSTSTGDGDLVGTIKPWAGMTAPSQYLFTYGQEVSRTTYSALYTAITSTQPVFCNSGSPTLSGVGDTSNFWVGMSVEVSCVAAGFSTIVSKTSSSVTLAANANVTTNTNAVFYPWGRGDGSTTFNLPDFRGTVLAGNNIMGGVASSLSTTTYFGATDPNSIGALGGNQSLTLTSANVPSLISTNLNSVAVSVTGTVPFSSSTSYTNTFAGGAQPIVQSTNPANITASGTIAINAIGTANTYTNSGGIATSASVAAGGSGYTNGVQTLTVSGGTCTTQPQINVNVAGNVVTSVASVATAGSCTVPPSNPVSTTGGGGTLATLNILYSALPASRFQPTKTTNYIIKVIPDSNSATASGVTDIQGMTGSISCGIGLTCTGNTISFGLGAVAGQPLISNGVGVSPVYTGTWANFDVANTRLILNKGTAAWSAAGTTGLHIIGDVGEARAEWTARNSDSVAVFTRLNGTFASPTALVANDQIMGLIAAGIDTAASTTMQQGGTIGAYASTNWTSSNHSTDFRFYSIRDTTVDFIEAMRVKDSGGIFLNKQLQVTPSSSGLGTGLASPVIQGQGSDGNPVVAAYDSYGTSTGSFGIYRTARGVAGTFTATQSGDTIGGFGWVGANGNNSFPNPLPFGAAGGTFILAQATENWSSTTNQGARMDIYTTPTGTGTVALAARFQASGGVSIGTSSDPGIGMLYTNSASFMIRTKTSYNNGAAAGAGTIANAPAAGNPTKWIPIDDNGTTRYIPAW